MVELFLPCMYRKKLIEVSVPLEAINAESAREKSIRHGHPDRKSTRLNSSHPSISRMPSSA